MKKISLFILSIFTVGVTLAQTLDDFSFEPPITDNNMSVVFPAGTLTEFAGSELKAYAVKYFYDNPVAEFLGEDPIDSVIIPTSITTVILEDGSAGVAVIGIDALCDCDLVEVGETIVFAILMNGEVIVMIDIDPPISYSANAFEVVNGSLTFLNQDGCTDPEANNFDEVSTQDDGSCVYSVPINFQLSSGWNMVGYTGTSEITDIVIAMDAALGNGAGTANTFSIIKNVTGTFWTPTIASLTDFTPGEGYMMYVNGATTSITFSSTVEDISYDLSSGWNMVAFTGDVDAGNLIVSAMDAALENGAGTANTFSIIKNVTGAFWTEDIALLTSFVPGEAYMMYVNGSPTTVNFQQ